jgi:Dyp-type peroxidase family
MAAAALNPDLESDDMQGLLASGYGHLQEARFLLLEIGDAGRAGRWLGRLADELTTARAKSRGTAVNVALATSGLAKLGLDPALARFSDRFLDGMTAPHRGRALGDVDADAPDRWRWGGPGGRPVDLLLLLYAEDKRSLSALERRLTGGGDGLEVVERLDTRWSDREHFGFRDGLSQPAIRELDPSDRQAVAAGEFVLGYENEYGLYTDRPLLAADADPGGRLPLDPQGSGRADLGRNGSYLVLRQLAQDVRRFWRFADQAADGGRGRDALAARLVGRWRSGAPLVLAPEHDDPELGASRVGAANAFDYAHMDPDGTRCPLGAHIRRANPRDSLDPDPGSQASLRINRRHRLIRRGRAYGPPITPEQALREADGAADDPRGLHFACLCGNLARQYEFVQHTWINNPKFHQLYEDPDPLIGPPGGTLTIQARPVRRRFTGLPEFVSVRGGAYFFLPGRRALEYLAHGPG